MSLLARYKNGNYHVEIFDDGTKFRETPDDYFDADFPENMDVKITDRCSQNCPFCYEGCTSDGRHAVLFNDDGTPRWMWMRGLHAGTEIALNGNDLDHPQLEQFLTFLKQNGVLANVTVNQRQFENNFDKLFDWCNHDLIHGLGISLRHFTYEFDQMCRWFSNIVIHTIFGVTPIEEYMALEHRNYRVLILGYKNKNRGVDWMTDKSHGDTFGVVDVRHFKEYLAKITSDTTAFKVISFDNLALEQLDIKNLLFTGRDDEWEMIYQGDDGTHTFYMDLVQGRFAHDSTQTMTYDIGDLSLEEMLDHVKNNHQ